MRPRKPSAKANSKSSILEKNKKLGEKLCISGGGRCNITNAEYDTHKLLAHYGNAANFLHSPYAQFGVKDTFTFFESRGLPLVVQARNRAFPKTEKASDVVRTMEKFLKDNAVFIKEQCPVLKVLHEKNDAVKNGAAKSITGLETNQGIFRAKSYIFATGGVSHPETGSTGDGFGWLRDLGHTVKTPTPTIVPLAVEDAWIKSLAGVSLSFMKITFYLDDKSSSIKPAKFCLRILVCLVRSFSTSPAKLQNFSNQAQLTQKLMHFQILTLAR